MSKTILISFLLLWSFTICAQNKAIVFTHIDSGEYFDWHLKDLTKDSIPGISLERTYDEFLKDKEGKQVIVALIDSSIDLGHPDLKDVFYINKDEIPNNGIDDDGNGYIDDINGWNYLGYETDQMVTEGVYSHISIIQQHEDYKNKVYNAPKVDTTLLSRAKNKYENQIKKFPNNLKQSKEQLNSYYWIKEHYSDIFPTDESFQLKVMDSIAAVNDSIKVHFDNAYLMTIGELGVKIIKNGVNDAYRSRYVFNNTNNRLWHKADPNLYDLEYNGYGTPYVQSQNEYNSHATEMATIIAAKRNNGIGMRGFSNNIKIMPLVVLNNATVRDKDFYNAIKYAVDNGANVINYSFGKSIVENSSVYLKAMKYARDNNVLVISAAGNENLDLDLEENFHFPGYQISKDINDFSTYLKVGASSRKYTRTLLPRFANYGRNGVDIFAPGYSIWVGSSRGFYIAKRHGSSISSAITSGVAALILSYYPNLKASELKDLILKTGLKTDIKVRLGKQEDTAFSTLSKTGSIVNVYNAFKYLETKE